MKVSDLAPDEADPLPCVMAKLGRLVERRISSALVGEGVGASQFIALMYLESRPNSSRSELARGIQISPQAAGGLVDRLCAKGLVVRTHSQSGSPMELQVTDDGCQLVERARPIVAGLNQEMLELFKPSHAAFLEAAPRHLLRRLSPEQSPQRSR